MFPTLLPYIFAFIIGMLVTAFMTPKILFVSIWKRLIDKTNARKIHTCLASRFGGVAFFPGICFSISLTVGIYALFRPEILMRPITPVYILGTCACLLMYIVGVADDIAGVRYRSKFTYQIIAATCICLSGIWIKNLHGLFGIHDLSPWIGIPLSILLIVSVINSINLIDGIDGLASGLSIIALIVIGVTFIRIGESAPALLSFASAGTLTAFLRYNLYGIKHKKIKIFMGDSGSLLIGTLLGILTIKLCCCSGNYTEEEYRKHILIAYSLLIVPCFDVLRVMFNRKKQGKPLFLPDKNHIHHKFMALGLNQRQTLCAILSLSVFFTTVNLLLSSWIDVHFILLIDIALWITIHMWISYKITLKPEQHESTTHI